MSPNRCTSLLAWLSAVALTGAAAAASAQTPPPGPPPRGSVTDPGPVTAPGATAEPNVQRIVTEDEGSKIEELRVRGNTTRISVTPKVGTLRGYEIITEDGSRDVSDGLTASRGAAGKRVWRVLSF